MQSPVIANNIKALSSAKENHYFDRKSARIKPEDLARHIIAFANASGRQEQTAWLRANPRA